MPKLHIDGVAIEVEHGTSLLEAARRLGRTIPTLCHAEGLEPATSCMVCVVFDRLSGRLLPSCSARAEDGQDIDTDGEEVQAARRTSLELLLSDHVGDCEAPCQRICPAHLDIPGMLRAVAAAQPETAARLAHEALLMPGVLGRICPAPCEKGCRRGSCDEPVSIRALHAFVAAGGPPERPAPAAPSGRRAAVVGAGPAGLAAAFHLRRLGHACTLFDAQAEPGGALRYALTEAQLPRALLDAELAPLLAGIVWKPGVRIGRDLALDDLRRDFDAVLLAPGASREADGAAWSGLARTAKGFTIDAGAMQTSLPGVFAGGDAVHSLKMAVRALADGRRMAQAADRVLRGGAAQAPPELFNSRFGRLHACEGEALLQGKNPAGRTPSAAALYHEQEARAEAQRCLDCDCRKAATCLLRREAHQYGARQDRYKPEARRPVEIVRTHPDLVYEPGKCIRCGLCIRTARAQGEPLGLAFVERGYAMRVEAPFHEALAAALTHAAGACVAVCPTAALAWADWEKNGASR